MKAPAALLLFVALDGTLAAQARGPVEHERTAFSDAVASEYVLIPATVEDSRGNFADGLEKRNFRLTVDGRPVAVDSFARNEGAPVSFAFLLDTSGSMKTEEKLQWAKRAIQWVLRHSRPGDEFALFAFSDGRVRILADFGASPRELGGALRHLQPDGDTALYDALAATSSRMVRGANEKRAILLFTDGVDNASAISAEQLKATLEQVSIPVYPIALVTVTGFERWAGAAPQPGVETLESLAAASGGKLFLARQLEDMRGVISNVNKELRRQYLLGFSPSGVGASRFRTMRLSVEKPGDWKIRTRRGYRGTSPRPSRG